MSQLYIIVFALCTFFFMYVLFSRLKVPPDHFAIISKHYSFRVWRRKSSFETISADGRPGLQVQTLGPGVYYGYPKWKYSFEIRPFLEVGAQEIAVVSAREGAQPPRNKVLGAYVECNDFQDGAAFLKNGGVKGRQTRILRPGKYKINPHLFDVFTSEHPPEGLGNDCFKVTSINPDQIGIVTVSDGKQLPQEEIAGVCIPDHSAFQDVDRFIENGGFKGLQEEVLTGGDYFLNPWFAKVEKVPLVKIPAGVVGVLISNIGSRTGSSDAIARYRGIQDIPLKEGMHPINTRTHDVQPVPTFEITLKWSDAEKDSNNYDADLKPLKLRSADRWEFEIEITQVIKIDPDSAPQLIHEIGVGGHNDNTTISPDQKFSAVRNLITRRLQPTIAAHFANVAQNYSVLEFNNKREQLQGEASEAISLALSAIGVIGRRTDITQIELPKEIRSVAQKIVLERQNIELIQAQQVSQTEQTELERRKAETEAVSELEKLKINLQAAEYEDEIKRKEIDRELDRIRELVTINGGPQEQTKREVAQALANIKMPESLIVGAGGEASVFAQLKAISDLISQTGLTKGLENRVKTLTADGESVT